LLKQVEKLAESLEHPTDVAYTCETSDCFYTSVLTNKWEKFVKKVYVCIALIV